MSPRTGRPTDNPKQERIAIRLDAKCSAILKAYTEKFSVSGAEAVRSGILKLENDIKEQSVGGPDKHTNTLNHQRFPTG